MTDPVFRLTGAESIERRGLRDHVYERVLDVLLGSDIEPGMRLSIDAVARELGVSPTPVREALVQLERTGLVTRVANKGYRVAPPLADDQLDALFDARLVLESGAAALASAHEAALVPRLQEALAAHEAMTAVVRATDGDLPVALLREYFAVDWNFHHLIFEGTHNPFLIDMSEAISTRVHRMRQTVQTGVSDADDAVVEHRAIVDAFAAGPEAAAAAMRAHIERVRERSRRDSVRAR
ncbi:GntR family transcriptional regulator [Rathayibacter sp. VKM Ac-2856]|uniref:GntR family transcriptional regulator n=1 Tax=unclassified Rathayibacter TaxID=2609250 RepID=UPI001562FE71|nr:MULTISPECIES: GntR family transcriptional regulator [unclassified Rathayibacter]NQX05134.1 GntR family transcriptional regulator [Rathayibacter sp. VKM Ac-2858]NQX20301.1 GntR family transcriptional regulator [Rathayibacter sp. VKM Ac-2856]